MVLNNPDNSLDQTGSVKGVDPKLQKEESPAGWGKCVMCHFNASVVADILQ